MSSRQAPSCGGRAGPGSRSRWGTGRSTTTGRSPKAKSLPEGGKLVRYWAAEACGGEFTPGAETDELRWMDAADAAGLLSYQHDVDVLERFAKIGPPVSVIALVR